MNIFQKLLLMIAICISFSSMHAGETGVIYLAVEATQWVLKHSQEQIIGGVAIGFAGLTAVQYLRSSSETQRSSRGRTAIFALLAASAIVTLTKK